MVNTKYLYSHIHLYSLYLVQEDTLLIQVQILVVVPEMAVELDVVDPLDMVESQQVMNLLADLLL